MEITSRNMLIMDYPNISENELKHGNETDNSSNAKSWAKRYNEMQEILLLTGFEVDAHYEHQPRCKLDYESFACA